MGLGCGAKDPGYLMVFYPAEVKLGGQHPLLSEQSPAEGITAVHPSSGLHGEGVGIGSKSDGPFVALIPRSLLEAVGCREDPVGVQDAPATDVLLVVLDAHLPGPRLHRRLLTAQHARGLSTAPAG